jgi:hypothetical protein
MSHAISVVSPIQPATSETTIANHPHALIDASRHQP